MYLLDSVTVHRDGLEITVTMVHNACMCTISTMIVNQILPVLETYEVTNE